LYLETDKIQLAQKTLEIAVKLGEKSKNNFVFLEALEAMGDCLVKQNLNTKGQILYEKALKIAEKHSFLEKQSLILIKLA
jgi:hypothetical protein